MALLIPNYPDPFGVAGKTIEGAYAWIGELNLQYHDGTARFTIWVHQGDEEGATWPSGDRIRTVATLVVYCGARVVGYPDVTFPTLSEIEERAATIAEEWYSAATTDEERLAMRAACARGAAMRAALYAYVEELIFPGSQQVD